MRTIMIIIGGAALLAALASGVVAQSSHHGDKPMDAATMTKVMQDMMPTASDNASTKAYKESHMKMMKDMHITFSGNADVDFVRNMIPHHQGAIDMAKVELQHGKNPTLKKMAQKIIADQEKEIAQMQVWLKKHAK